MPGQATDDLRSGAAGVTGGRFAGGRRRLGLGSYVLTGNSPTLHTTARPTRHSNSPAAHAAASAARRGASSASVLSAFWHKYELSRRRRALEQLVRSADFGEWQALGHDRVDLAAAKQLE